MGREQRPVGGTRPWLSGGGGPLPVVHCEVGFPYNVLIEEFHFEFYMQVTDPARVPFCLRVDGQAFLENFLSKSDREGYVCSEPQRASDSKA
jgi:hypothetical protein